MPSKVFISCGQATQQERDAANEVANYFRSLGFYPYVATQVQSIPDLNQGIIEELKSSDYYLFINFRREQILQNTGNSTSLFRGSLYTNQELAVAYAYGFEKMLFLNQRNTERGGMFGIIVSNSPEFDDYSDVIPAVQSAVTSADWLITYSRHLAASDLRWGPLLRYRDHTGERVGKTLHINIANNRPDKAATHCAARLFNVTCPATGDSYESPDKSPLKVSGQSGYFQAVWPSNHGAFDLLNVDNEKFPFVFLNSALDVSPRQPIIRDLGTFHLKYEVYSENFPKLSFVIKLKLEPSGPSASLI
jgi:hypothetical protein